MIKRILILSVLLLLCKASPAAAEELQPDVSRTTEVRAYVDTPEEEEEPQGVSDAPSDGKDTPGTNETHTIKGLKTGDESSPLPCLVLMAASTMAVTGLWIYQKNK